MMKRIEFDIKYRPEIESGKYKVETRDGRSVEILKWDAKVRKEEGFFLIVCVDCGESIPYIYDSKGKIHEYLVNGTHLDLVIYTDETGEHPLITELKKHLSSLSEEDKEKEWKELQDWYDERFKPAQRDWVEEFREYIEAMSPEEFEKEWQKVKERCGDGERKKTDLTEFEYAVLSVISDHNSHKDSIEEFAKRNAEKLLELARKELEPEFDKELEKAYKNQDKVVYRRGREDVLKGLPKWEKDVGNGISSGMYVLDNRGDGNILLCKKDWKINVIELGNLPYENDILHWREP